MAFNINRRTGLPSILRVAKELCRFIVLFTPYIQRLYGSNAALMAALAAANAACAVLVEQVQEVVDEGV